MNKSSSAPLLCGLVAFFGQGSVLSTDWAGLEQRLAAAEPFDITAMRHNSDYQAIVTSRNQQFIYEMIGVGDRPLVTLAGFYALYDLFPERAYETAMVIAGESSSATLLIYAPVFRFLTNSVPFEVFRASFTRVMQSVPFRQDSFTLIVNSVPLDLLERWFHAADRAWAITSKEAMVVARLCDNLSGKRRPLGPKVRSTLEQYADVPGLPRLVFLYYYEETVSELYARTVKTLFEDETVEISDLVSLVRKRPEYFSNKAKIEAYKMTQARREAVAKAIAPR